MDSKKKQSEREANRVHCRKTRQRKKQNELFLKGVRAVVLNVVWCLLLLCSYLVRKDTLTYSSSSAVVLRSARYCCFLVRSLGACAYFVLRIDLYIYMYIPVRYLLRTSYYYVCARSGSWCVCFCYRSAVAAVTVAVLPAVVCCVQYLLACGTSPQRVVVTGTLYVVPAAQIVREGLLRDRRCWCGTTLLWCLGLLLLVSPVAGRHSTTTTNGNVITNTTTCCMYYMHV